MPESKTRLQVSNISDMFKCTYDDVKLACDFQELHIVYDSYLESSMRESDRIRGQVEHTPCNLPASKERYLCLSK